MDHANRWYFTKENLENTPSRQCGVDALKENSYRQQAANFIQDMGQRLHVTQLCINTAIVYMHRFYMFHSFTKQHRNHIAVAALFLAAKVEEQPRKLEHTVRVAHKCLNRGKDVELKPDVYLQKSNELVYNENMMLQTLGFDIAIDHPHTYVVKLLQLVKASKELAQTSYFMATNSLHLTTMCLQYRPTVVACVCINIACKWSDWKIEPSTEGKEWYYYVDKAVTPELLEELTKDFILVLEKSPNRLRRRIYPANSRDVPQPREAIEFRAGDDLATHMENLPYDNCIEPTREQSPIPSTCPSTSSASVVVVKEEKVEKQQESSSSSVPNAPASVPPPPIPQPPLVKPKVEPQHSISLAVYREKREKERHLDQKPVVPAPVELPAQPVVRNVPPVHNKHMVPIKSEKLSPKPGGSFNDHVPQKQPVLKSNSTHQPSANTESTSSDKNNHQMKKMPAAAVLPSPHAPPAPHPPQPVPQPPKTSLPKVKADLMKALSDGRANDPFVLLTRLDHATVAQKSGEAKVVLPQPPPPPAQSVKVNVKNSSLNARPPVEVRSVPPPPTVPANACDTVKSEPKGNETHLTPTRPKHSKQKTQSLQNSHTDAQLLSQGNLPNQALVWDVGQANGSNVPDLSLTNSRVPVHAPQLVDHRSGEKNTEVHVKSEKRERHKHRHSVHSSKEKSSNHICEGQPEKALKITIPMDKILLRGNQKSNASHGHESPRKSLKIKLPVPKESPAPKPTPMQSPLKLVITKDKNAGSYSAIHKAEKSSRKRDRSPSSRDHNSRSTKQHKADHSQVDKIPAKTDRQNNVAWNTDSSYNQNSSAYVMQTVYYQQPYNNYYPMPTTNMQYGHMQPPPPPPPLPPVAPSSNQGTAPPLPRDPPPPLPPQPPMPSE